MDIFGFFRRKRTDQNNRDLAHLNGPIETSIPDEVPCKECGVMITPTIVQETCGLCAQCNHQSLCADPDPAQPEIPEKGTVVPNKEREKVPCDKCRTLILPITAEKTGGLCIACANSTRTSVDTHEKPSCLSNVQCGESQDDSHDWWGCKCRTCGKVRDEEHAWDKGVCSVCGASVNQRDYDGWTLLHTAAHRGDINAVMSYIQGGADLNAQLDGGQTPLHLAVQNYHADIARLLVQNGANIHIKDLQGSTADDYAVASVDGLSSMIEMLTDRAINSSTDNTNLLSQADESLALLRSAKEISINLNGQQGDKECGSEAQANLDKCLTCGKQLWIDISTPGKPMDAGSAMLARALVCQECGNAYCWECSRLSGLKKAVNRLLCPDCGADLGEVR